MPACPIVDSLCAKMRREACGDGNVQRVIGKLLERSKAGQIKYGTTLAREDLTRDDWLNHAQQEAMDLANYLEVLILRGAHCLEDAQKQTLATAATLEAMLWP
jgi:hypothetical protein